MPDFIGRLTVDRGQTILTCDEHFARLFDTSPGDITGKSLDELFSPRDRRGALELSTRLIRSAGELVDLIITLRIGGHDHLARLRLQPTPAGHSVYVERVFGDTDLVYRLTVVAERWKGMFRSSEDGIVVLDERGAIIEHNAAFYRLMGFRDAHGVTLSEDAVVGRQLVDLIGTRIPALAKYLGAPAGDLRVRVDELELKATPIELPSRERIGTFVLVRDVTEEAQVEARDAIIRRDLTQARAFQQMILQAPPKVASHDIDVVYRPVEQVGGDVYDVSILPDRRVRMFIADATGHGVTAALVTMLIKSAYDQVRTVAAPNELLAQLNDRVARTARTLDAMFTAAVVDIDLSTRQIVHASAAHLAPLLVREAGVVELECGGTFMGVSSGRVYPSWSRPLPADAALYLLTDGIAEARRANGELFGEDRVFRALVDANPLPHGAGDAVLARLDAWLRPALPNDDITILALRPRAN